MRKPKFNAKVAAKFDAGKTMWSAMPLLAIRQVKEVMTKGAQKYAKFNYISGAGLPMSRMLDGAQRHIDEYVLEGRTADPDTGKHPLAHAAAELLMALEHILMNKETFDFPYEH